MRFKGRAIYKGKAEGEALVYNSGLSFLGGVAPEKGEIIENHKSITDKIFSFERSVGSTVGSYIIYGLKYYKKAPRAMIVNVPDETFITGSLISEIPSIAYISSYIFQDGDIVYLDGDYVELDVDVKEVVTSILVHGDEMLLLKRSGKVSTYQGKWAGVSGYIEDLDPLSTAIKEIKEETGIENPVLLRNGGKIYVRDNKRLWIVHNFLFHVKNKNVKIDWEHLEFKWIKIKDFKNFDTVPGLDRVVQNLLL
ncbi:MAG: aconitase X swivel domain-containing protein [Thermoplasmata archaeon]